MAESLELATIWVTAGDGNFLAAMMSQLARVSVSVAGVSVAAAGTPGAATTPSLGRALQDALEKACRAAQNHGYKGLVIFIDEIQEGNQDGLRALAYAWQHLQAEAPELPLAALTAGLSHTQDVITDAVSFAERFTYVHLHNLTPDAASDALRTPAPGFAEFIREYHS